MVLYTTKRLAKLGIIGFIVILFNGCDNSLNVTADWKEIPIVYGLLNPSASVNYIRINRAYLNQEGDAISYGAVADSINFEDLTVSLVEIRNGIEGNTINFTKVDGDTIGLPKDPGVFAQSPNILYRTNYDIKATDFANLYNYELVIVNNNSNKVYRSKANMVGDSEILSPLRENDPRFNIDDDTNRYIYIIYREAPQAKMYDCVIRFRYKEYEKTNPSQVRIDSVDWQVFSRKETIRLRGYEEQQTNVRSYLFYDFLSSAMEADPNIERVPIDMGFFLYAAGEDMYTYIEVNQPSIGIVQKKPEFTNITDGLGIFSSLNIKSLPHIKIDDPMLSRLTNSQRVEDLNFVRP
ncbi:MAG: hypothetical protein ACI8SE_002209 [Bacteroidia bacterium]|jgi:hypothetical protein